MNQSKQHEEIFEFQFLLQVMQSLQFSLKASLFREIWSTGQIHKIHFRYCRPSSCNDFGWVWQTLTISEINPNNILMMRRTGLSSSLCWRKYKKWKRATGECKTTSGRRAAGRYHQSGFQVFLIGVSKVFVIGFQQVFVIKHFLICFQRRPIRRGVVWHKSQTGLQVIFHKSSLVPFFS